MSDWKLNKDGDLDLNAKGYKDLQLVTGNQELVQRLQIRLKSIKNDWFLDLDDGIDYFGEALKKNPNLVILSAIFKSEILDTKGVLAITYFNYDYDIKERVNKVIFKVKSIYGESNEIDILMD